MGIAAGAMAENWKFSILSWQWQWQWQWRRINERLGNACMYEKCRRWGEGWCERGQRGRVLPLIEFNRAGFDSWMNSSREHWAWCSLNGVGGYDDTRKTKNGAAIFHGIVLESRFRVLDMMETREWIHMYFNDGVLHLFIIYSEPTYLVRNPSRMMNNITAQPVRAMSIHPRIWKI